MRQVQCIVCSEVFGLDDDTYAVLYRSHRDFSCPFGHMQHFTKYPKRSEKPDNVVKLNVIDGDKM